MKSVLITGCSSGLGRGMVDEFLKRGWRVFCTMRDAQQRQYILAEALEEYPNQLIILDLEVTDITQRNAVMKAILESGSLDCLVNNAGFGLLGALEDLSEEQIRYQMEVNFYAPVFLTRGLLPLLRQAKGNVVFISSVCGYVGLPLMSAYCSSKHGLEGFADALYYELEPHGVDVSLIEVGLTKTNYSKNAIWGMGNSPIYRQQTKNYLWWKDELNRKVKNNVPIVAKKVVDIAEGKHRQLRVQVGEEANLTRLLQRILPERIWVQGLKMLYRRKLLKK
jgi:NAD(P)-dependent dehydrogenase (short-subunit alcohol dehydrogenase family)